MTTTTNTLEALSPMVTDSEQGDLIKTDRLGRIHVMPEHREALLDKFEQSGISGPQFAKQHGIKYPTFANWCQKRKRMRGADAQQVENNPSALVNSLTEVVSGYQGKRQSLRVDVGGGVHIEVSNDMEVALAAKLINHLRGHVSQHS